MRTLVVSDLHLGKRSGGDLLRRRPARRTLFGELQGADQVVLLGDCLDLREADVPGALAAALAFFEELAEALGSGRVVVVPGNHDHALATGWRQWRGSSTTGLEFVADAREVEPLRRVSARMGAAELVVAYPGLWIRPDVYATHGHYLDCHNTVPTFERIAIAAQERLARGLPVGGRLSPCDYEAVLEPVYARIARGGRLPRPRALAEQDLSIRLWQRLGGAGGTGPAALVLREAVFPGAVALLNAAGLGPLKADLSGPELRRAALRAMAEVVRHLGIRAGHVIFGHTHRAGPFRGEEEDFTLPDGLRLWNTGSWVYEPALLGDPAADSPYRPGVCALVEEAAPPRLERLLPARTSLEARA